MERGFSSTLTFCSSSSPGDELQAPRKEFSADVLPPLRGLSCRTSKPTPCPPLSPRCHEQACQATRGSHGQGPRPGRLFGSLEAQEEPREIHRDFHVLRNCLIYNKSEEFDFVTSRATARAMRLASCLLFPFLFLL